MKILTLTFSIFFLDISQAAMIRLAFSGTVDEVTEGTLFPENSLFRVEIDYMVPVVAGDQSPTEVTYTTISTDSRLVIDGTIFSMPNLFVAGNLELDPGGNSWLLGWGASDPLGAGIFSSLFLSFRIPETDIDDPGRLPSSLDQWDLNAGTLEVSFYHEDTSQNPDVVTWAFRSTTLSPITLGEIPEPSSALMLCLGAIGLLRRNRINS